jgi:hypothetical protein
MPSNGSNRMEVFNKKKTTHTEELNKPVNRINQKSLFKLLDGMILKKEMKLP